VAGALILIALALGSIAVPWRKQPIPEPIWLLAVGTTAGRLLGAPAWVVRGASSVGLLALLFTVGVELASAGHRPLSRAGARVALVGAAVLALVGGLATSTLTGDLDLTAALVIAAIPTSAGIASRIASPVGVPHPISYPEIVAAAVADDFLGLALLVLAPVLLPGVSEARALIVLGASAGLAIGFLALKLTRVPLRLVRALALAAAGLAVGVSPALVGVFVGHDLPEAEGVPVVRGAARVLAPLFFVASGEQLDPSLLVHPAVLATIGLLLGALLVSRAAMVLAASGTRRARWHVGSAMLPRGEVTIAIGLVLLRAHVLGPSAYAALIGLVVASTLASGIITPRLHPHATDGTAPDP